MIEPFEEFASTPLEEPDKSTEQLSGGKDEKEALFQELIIKALEDGKQSKFEFIKNYAELQAVKTCQTSLKKVIKMFERVAAAIYKEYCSIIASGQDDFNLLYIYKQYIEVIRYYKQELATAEDMLDEYDNYTWSGHLLQQYLFFQTRPDEDLVDTRKKNGTK